MRPERERGPEQLGPSLHVCVQAAAGSGQQDAETGAGQVRSEHSLLTLKLSRSSCSDLLMALQMQDAQGGQQGQSLTEPQAAEAEGRSTVLTSRAQEHNVTSRVEAQAAGSDFQQGTSYQAATAEVRFAVACQLWQSYEGGQS